MNYQVITTIFQYNHQIAYSPSLASYIGFFVARVLFLLAWARANFEDSTGIKLFPYKFSIIFKIKNKICKKSANSMIKILKEGGTKDELLMKLLRHAGISDETSLLTTWRVINQNGKVLNYSVFFNLIVPTLSQIISFLFKTKVTFNGQMLAGLFRRKSRAIVITGSSS